MGKVYATREDDGERVLYRIECDGRECAEFIHPHRDIATSGWVKRGIRQGDVTFEYSYCPSCASRHE